MPCAVVSITASEVIPTEHVYYKQPEKAFTWQDFRQEPACGFPINYTVYLRDDPSEITEVSSPLLGISTSEMQLFEPLVPPVVQTFDSASRTMTLTSSSKGQVDKVLDVYIVGDVEVYDGWTSS